MSGLAQALGRNWNLKASSLGLAVFLWAVVQAEPAERELLSSVPVRVQVGDLGWTLSGAPEPTVVQVRFAGPATQIQDLNRDGASVRIPVAAVTSADTVVQLRRDWVVVEGGSGLVVQDIVPGSVRLQFEESRQVALPLSIRTRGVLPRGVALAAPIGLAPAVVRVRGPARVLDRLESIPLMPLDLGEVSSSGMVEVPVDTAGLSGLTLTPVRAQLGIRVETAEERLLPGVDVEIEGPAAAALQVEPAQVQVMVQGARGRLEAASLDSIRVEVSADQVQDVVPGETRRVALRLRGVPELLQANAGVDSVTVRRPRSSEESQDARPSGDSGGDS